MTVMETLTESVGETVDSMELPALLRQSHLEPRCRICRNDQLRKKINDMLTAGLSYAMILRAVEGDNTKLDGRDRISIDSIRNHTSRHFPVQNVARATYRAILERRAKENGVDFVEGVATALLPVTFFEVAMNKAFRHLVDDDAEVSIDTGLRAAEKLQSLLDRRDQGDDIAELRLQVYRIQDAVKAVVPQKMWGAIVEKLDQPQHPEATDAETEDFDDDDDGYDPTEFTEEDDES